MVTAVRRWKFAYTHGVFVGGRSGRGLYGEAPDERTDGVSPHGVPSAVEMGGNALGDVMDDTGVGMESWGIGFYDEVETEGLVRRAWATVVASVGDCWRRR